MTKYYEKELKALKKANRYRKREVVDYHLKDFASNDYLGLAHNKTLHQKSSQVLANLPINAPKASLLVGGYHQVHKDLEEALCQANGFEDGVVVGSGFNANLALIEALVRKNDMLFIDELYHASGVLATKLQHINVIFFRHNDMQHLKELLQKYSHIKRKIIAVEGIYSMDGDMCQKEVFALADAFDALLIVDEAHSSGVVGNNLMGVFDYYDITIQPNYIKMGTLGKAYGSFGAFILASSHIIDYLLNRAKPLIYATALSLYDTILAYHSLEYILQNKDTLKKQIKKRQQIVYEELKIKCDGLIAPIIIGDNQKIMQIKESLLKDGYSVGAIRQPTVKKPIIRLILRLYEDEETLKKLCQKISLLRNQ